MRKTHQSGFSMVELIIAIALFAIAIPIVALLISTLSQLNDSAADTVVANSVAENKIESLRSKGFNGISDGTTTFSNELPTTLPVPRTASYTISSVSTSLKSVTVTISYGGKQTEYKTYLGELGVGQY
jgi:prepilin-type N-terminal cleavage/methylation domain-containing protein